MRFSRMMNGFWVVGICLLFLSACQSSATLEGKITYARQSDVVIGQAEIHLNGHPRTVSRPLTGAFLIQNLKPGEYALSVHKQGFLTLRQRIVVEPAQKLNLNLELAPEHQASQSQDGLHMLFANTGQRALARVHSETGVWQPTLSLPGIPEEAVLSEDQRYLYLSIPEAHQIAVLNIAAHTFEAPVPLGEQISPLFLARTRDWLIMLNQQAQTVVCVEMAQRRIYSPCLNTTEVSGPVALSAAAPGEHVHLLTRTQIHALDGTTVVRRYDLGRKYTRARLYWHAATRLFLIHSLVGNNLYVFNPASGEQENRLNPATGLVQVVAPPGSAKIYVLFQDRVRSYDLFTQQWGPEVPTGGQQALSAAWHADSGLLYILDAQQGLLRWQPDSLTPEKSGVLVTKIAPDRFWLWNS
jgi:hypothetical protein